MKLNTQGLKVKSGMTLLELTVVILVLLSLISILFVGARAWKKGSDRSANILNVRNVQQAVRGQQNTREATDGASCPSSDLFATDTGYMKQPIPPAAAVDNAYTFAGTYPTQQATPPSTAGLYITNPAVGSSVDGEYFYSSAELSAGKINGW